MSRNKDRAGENEGFNSVRPGIIYRNLRTRPNSGKLVVGKVFFDTWEYREKVTIDGLTTFEPIDDRINRVVPVNNSNWEQVVLKSAELASHRLIGISGEGRVSVAAFSAMGKNDRAGAFFRSSFGFVERMHSAKDLGQMTEVLKERGNYLRRAGADIRRTQDWGYVAEVARELKAAEQDDLVSQTAYLVGIDLRALLLLAGKQNKFLAGVDQQRAYWKDVELPPVYELTGLPIVHITNPFVSFLDQVRGDQLVAMPGKLIEPKNYKKIVIPEQEETIPGVLKDVLKNQAYTMTREGFAANLADSGDVTKMVVVESNGLVFCKGETKYGDLSAIILKDQAKGYFSDMLPEMVIGKTSLEEMARRTRFGVLAARVYRDYLCPEEITLTGPRPEYKPRQPGEKNKAPEQRRNVRRVIVHDETTGPIPDKQPFTGQLVPNFIQVSGYVRPRDGGASDRTLRRAANWKAESSFDLPEFDPKTEEPIIPYTKPPGMQIWYYNLPEFWREELREETFKPTKGFVQRS